jgi:type II secretory pathway pseudopilin PulG
MLAVLLIMGIVAMIGLPALSGGINDARLVAGANEVVTAMEYARLSAMTGGNQTRVTVDAAADSIEVERFVNTADILGGGSELTEGDVEGGAFETMQNPMNRGTDYQIVIPDLGRAKEVDIAVVDFGGGEVVTFSALGSPSAGGSVTLTLGSRQVLLTVDALTGQITTSE